MIGLLIALVVLVAIAFVAKYIIDKFFPGELHVPALLIVGLLLLIALLYVAARFTGITIP